MEITTPSASPALPGPGLAALIVLGLVAYLGAYIAVGTMAFHLTGLYGGFLLVYFWTGPMAAAPSAFWPAICGGVTGFALAAASYYLPTAFGMAGLFASVTLILLAIWLLLQGRFPLFVNLSAMLFLTVAAIPVLLNPALLLDAFGCFLLMIVFLLPLYVWTRRQDSAAANSEAELDKPG